jgi:hypothetical protein
MENASKPSMHVTVLTGGNDTTAPAVDKVAQFLQDSATVAAAAAGAPKAKAQVKQAAGGVLPKDVTLGGVRAQGSY